MAKVRGASDSDLDLQTCVTRILSGAKF